jgi:hypothetical protein
MYRLESGRSLASQLNRAQPMDFIATEASPKAAKLASTDRRSGNNHRAYALNIFYTKGSPPARRRYDYR